jgi:hypothetical protein
MEGKEKSGGAGVGKDESIYTLSGVKDEAGNPGTLKFHVKPGGNVHAEFDPDPLVGEGLPGQPGPPSEADQAQQLPAQPGPATPSGEQPTQLPSETEQAGQEAGETGEGEPPQPGQQPA